MWWSHLTDPDNPASKWAMRVLGAFAGAMVSVIIVAPEGTRNALYRVWVGGIMGVIFTPVVPQIAWLSFFAGEAADLDLARAAFAGFSAWFALELFARLMSSTDWVEKLLREVLRLRSGPSRDDKGD